MKYLSNLFIFIVAINSFMSSIKIATVIGKYVSEHSLYIIVSMWP